MAEIIFDNEIALKNTKERVNMYVFDATDTAVTPASIELTVLRGDNVQHRDGFPDLTLTGTVEITAAQDLVVGTNTVFDQELDVGDLVTANAEQHAVLEILSSTLLRLDAVHTAGAAASSAMTKDTTRIIEDATGRYYIDWGDLGANANADGNIETNQANCVFNFLWQVDVTGEEQESVVQTATVITARTAQLMMELKRVIDKSRKLTSDDPTDPCYLGYTDHDLLQYLRQGLSIINAYEPYPVWSTLDTFPADTFLHVLVESSLIAGVMSQQLFAIDTDIPNYSDQGNTFVIQHAPQLAAFLNTISLRLDKLIPMMKLKFVNSGSLHIEAGSNFRLAQLLQAAPSGALFRNVFFRG